MSARAHAGTTSTMSRTVWLTAAGSPPSALRGGVRPAAAPWRGRECVRGAAAGAGVLSATGAVAAPAARDPVVTAAR
jgi:hypothetical protein